jgi:glycosyltransferase involved in cell wall biosynthesis
MNIGLFNENFPPIYDGVSMTVRNYAYWLTHKGHNACVVTPDAPGKDDSMFEFQVHRYFSLPLIGRKPYRWGLPQFDRGFYRRMQDVPLDLIHAHTPFSSGNAALKIAKERGIPIVATFHSKYKSDFERQIPFQFIVDRMLSGVISFFNQVDEVWIPQASVEPTLREYGYRGPVQVMENGGDFSNLDVQTLRTLGRNELGVKEGETVLLFVGQHIWEKNIGFIIESLSLIKDMPFRFVTVGTGYATADIRKMADRFGIADKMLMLGQISDREQMKKVYAGADLFLFPSLYDTFGLVVREAAALNVPSLLIKGSDASNGITDGVNGFVVGYTSKEYAQFVQYLMQNPEIAAQVGKNASTSLVRGWDSVLDDVLERYDLLLRKVKR